MSNVRVGYVAAFPNGTLPMLRVGLLSVDGPPSVVVDPILDRTNVEPASAVAITATAAGVIGGSWVWRQVDGPAATLTKSGATVTFKAPSDLAGTSVILGVMVTSAGITSPEVFVSVSILPQTEWWWTGAAWVPRTVEFR